MQRRVSKSISSKRQWCARQLQADKRRSFMLGAERCSGPPRESLADHDNIALVVFDRVDIWSPISKLLHKVVVLD